MDIEEARKIRTGKKGKMMVVKNQKKINGKLWKGQES